MIHDFDAQSRPRLSEVGGKALALIDTRRNGFPVPPGFVLTTDFFAAWLDQLRGTREWAEMRTAVEGRAGLATAASALKAACDHVALSSGQQRAIQEGLRLLPDDALLAVRSSSPEEDLASASFAGGYESTLGVTEDTLASAIRGCFASLFSEHALDYRRQHGFTLDHPTIAVVVQQQVNADQAGVAFSLNPISNDHDEAVVNANRGLGESVVDGRVEPDHWVVDKNRRTIVERRIGSKEVSVRLADGGGTVELADETSQQPSLDEDSVQAIVDLVIRAEEWQQQPTDIEWAIDNGNLYLVQARPITTHVPISPRMATRPGERRILYWDIGLAEALTSNAPMSRLTLDWYFPAIATTCEPFVGPIDMPVDADPRNSLVFGAGGRMYLNLSQLLTLVGKRKLASGYQPGDELIADLLHSIDEQRYRATKKIPALRWGALLRRLPRALWHGRHFLGATFSVVRAPRRFRHRHDEAVRRAVARLRAQADRDASMRTVIEECLAILSPVMAGVSLPPILPYIYYLWRLDRVVAGSTAQDHELVDTMKLGFTENVAVDMGIRLYRMSRLLPAENFGDLDALARRLIDRDLPVEFLNAWDEFTARYGARGPGEMELSSPRYDDDPRLALEQMSYMAGSEYSPELRQREHVVRRDEAHQELRRRLSRRRRRRMDRAQRMIRLLGDTRDTPKHLLVVAGDAVRKRALRSGEGLVAQGRIERPEQVFDLTPEEIDTADSDPMFDVEQLRADRLTSGDAPSDVRAFPHFIDSRGRIPRVERDHDDPNVLVGAPVSRGTATGRVKVLHTPREKPVEDGDVLVAYTTDPGWTPLFVRADAVVLEVGGALQHGGVVAREYGKPCVAGIQGITTRLHDGMHVEVDGTTGLIRLLDQ